MLANFMEDIGITSEQFEKACAEGKRYVSFDNVNEPSKFSGKIFKK